MGRFSAKVEGMISRSWRPICERSCLRRGEPDARMTRFPDRLGALRTEFTAVTGLPMPRTQADLGDAGELPPWLGDPDFHRSHRSALVRKDPGYYRPVFPEVPDDLPYVWPR